MMRQCPKCGGEMADAHDTCGVCGSPIDAVELAGCPAEVPIMATLVESPFRPKSPKAPVGVPHRFSIGTMMILVTAFAILFGVLKTLDVDPAAFAVISIFIGGIAACQSLMFKGKKPRLASVVGGVIMLGLIDLVIGAVGLFSDPDFFGHAPIVILLATMVVQAVVLGGPLGYIIGCFVAAIFLVRKEPDDAESAPKNGS